MAILRTVHVQLTKREASVGMLWLLVLSRAMGRLRASY